jgi:hypothetical protein
VYDDEWMPELTCILKGDEARPITRLYHGTRFAPGILVSARRIGHNLPQSDVGDTGSRIWVKRHVRVIASDGRVVRVSGYSRATGNRFSPKSIDRDR